MSLAAWPEPSAAGPFLEVLFDSGHVSVELLVRAELDQLGSGAYEDGMARGEVVGLAGSNLFLAIGVKHLDATLDDVAPVWALAVIAGQSF